MEKVTLSLIVAITIVAIVLLALTQRSQSTKTEHFNGTATKAPANSCGTSSHQTCGAIDPVSDPVYNVKEIIKQSLLLEDHLIEKNKRCMDCIVKHFMYLNSYAEEALSLAGTSASKYPMLQDLPTFYNGLFDHWLANKDDTDSYLEAAERLRAKRKTLVAIYILKTNQVTHD